MNLFRDLPPRDRDGNLHVVVEVPRGSKVKLKYDVELGAFVWSRSLSLGLRFPYDFGFVPQTLAEDGDGLDAVVFAGEASYPGVVVPSRIIGALRVVQSRDGQPKKRNDRLLVVPIAQHRRDELADVSQLPLRVREETETFFAASLALTGKVVEFQGWASADEASSGVDAAALRYLASLGS
jgi:inorganic pyrophosphatase